MIRRFNEQRYQKKPLVSVILPVYNAEATLEKCLRSISNQTYEQYEVIIINDGSVDKSKEICQNYVADDQRFRLYSQENKGVSAARNLGLKKVQGEYIQFIDSDDEIVPDFLQIMVHTMMSCNVDMTVCDYVQKDIQKSQIDMEHFTIPEDTYSKRKYLSKIAKCPGAHYIGVLWNKLYKTELVRNGKIIFPETLSLGEDFVFNMHYLEFADRICCMSDKLYIYQWQSENSLCTKKKQEEKVIAERLEMYYAYEELFKKERLDVIWRPLMHHYILKAYYDELESLADSAEEYRSLLYQNYICKCGIGKIEFRIYDSLKKAKRMLNGGKKGTFDEQ